MVRGITVACGGFFGPQGRQLRIPLADPRQNEKIESFLTTGFKSPISKWKFRIGRIGPSDGAQGHDMLHGDSQPGSRRS